MYIHMEKLICLQSTFAKLSIPILVIAITNHTPGALEIPSDNYPVPEFGFNFYHSITHTMYMTILGYHPENNFISM